MYTLIGILIITIILFSIGAVYSVFRSKIKFYISGLDEGFNLLDISTLWEAAKICGLEDPNSLFYSMMSLTKCMERLTSEAASSNNQNKHQDLLSKLFDFRTKIQNETDQKKGIQTTLSLEKDQKLRIILPGKGVFTSRILNNGKQLIISVPKRKDIIEVPAADWIQKIISIYLWRKGDARYVFDTTVLQAGLFLGESALFIKHTNELVRTQKRKAVRADCKIYGHLYIIKEEIKDYNAVETQNGYKCLIEDISEAGALVRIGGKGVSNVQIKLQFNIQNMLIVMFGTIKNTSYNEEKNESLLHFECKHIDPVMRNEVLAFVYNMLPEKDKEVLEALSLTEQDFTADDSVDHEKGIDGNNEQEQTSENASKAAGDSESAGKTKTEAEKITAAQNMDAALSELKGKTEDMEIFPEPIILDDL